MHPLMRLDELKLSWMKSRDIDPTLKVKLAISKKTAILTH